MTTVTMTGQFTELHQNRFFNYNDLSLLSVQKKINYVFTAYDLYTFRTHNLRGRCEICPVYCKIIAECKIACYVRMIIQYHWNASGKLSRLGKVWLNHKKEKKTKRIHKNLTPSSYRRPASRITTTIKLITRIILSTLTVAISDENFDHPGRCFLWYDFYCTRNAHATTAAAAYRQNDNCRIKYFFFL